MLTPCDEYIEKATDSTQGWDEQIQAGVCGQFLLQKHTNNNGIHYDLRMKSTMPRKASRFTGLVLHGTDVDSSLGLKQRLYIGKRYLVDFKTPSMNPTVADESTDSFETLDQGTFRVLKSEKLACVIQFEGVRDIIKGIYNVDGIASDRFDKVPEDAPEFLHFLSRPKIQVYYEPQIQKSSHLNFVDFVSNGTDENAGVHLEYLNLAKRKSDDSKVVQLYKADEDRTVFGEVLVPDEVDAHGDIYGARDVQLAAWFFMEKFANIGLMHEKFINGDVKILETFIAPVDMMLVATDGTKRSIKKGTWMMRVRILKDELWGEVKAGLLTGFSIGGIATVQELKKMLGASHG